MCGSVCLDQRFEKYIRYACLFTSPLAFLLTMNRGVLGDKVIDGLKVYFAQFITELLLTFMCSHVPGTK